MPVPEDTGHRWPGRVAVGVVRGDPPLVFLASTEAVLTELIATRAVAPSMAGLTEMAAAEIREALEQQRWADAVVMWMEATGEVVDAYPDEEVVSEETLKESID